MNLLIKTLKEEFVRRKTKRSSYTRKKFAQDIGVSAGQLSGMMSGTYGISPKRSVDLINALSLSEAESNELSLFIAANYSRSKKARNAARKAYDSAINFNEYELVSEQTFSKIMHWYHFAIVELAKTRPFKANSDYIAKRLGISRKEASEAVRKLKQLGLIKISHGKIEPSRNHLEVLAKTSSSAMKAYHRQLIEKALVSMNDPDYTRREINSLLCAIDPADLPLVKQAIQVFVRDVDRQISCDEPKELYGLTVQLFPISVNDKEMTS